MKPDAKVQHPEVKLSKESKRALSKASVLMKCAKACADLPSLDTRLTCMVGDTVGQNRRSVCDFWVQRSMTSSSRVNFGSNERVLQATTNFFPIIFFLVPCDFFRLLQAKKQSWRSGESQSRTGLGCVADLASRQTCPQSLSYTIIRV